ncbi:MAG: class I SAM-dependent methyltransferase [Deltaproteobacteria bacterium]|nr:class I SAM-dependent methyltransferase [Deltaproteobacteria bacterium]
MGPWAELPWKEQLYYLRAYASWSTPSWRTLEPTPEIVERAARLVPGRALDVGCGFGRDTFALAELGWDVVGLDLSRRAISAARAAAIRKRANVELVRGPASKLCVEGPFDLGIDVLGPASDLEGDALTSYTKRLATLMRPGGTLLVLTFRPELVARFPFELVERRALRGTRHTALLELRRAAR